MKLVLFLFVTTGVFAQTGSACLPYSVPVKLQGTITLVTFPGPPNYASVKDGDRAETNWVLHVKRPVCTVPQRDYMFSIAESNVMSLQLIVDIGQLMKATPDVTQERSFLKVPVLVTGSLMHAETGHHHTKVMMIASRVERL